MISAAPGVEIGDPGREVGGRAVAVAVLVAFRGAGVEGGDPGREVGRRHHAVVVDIRQAGRVGQRGVKDVRSTGV